MNITADYQMPVPQDRELQVAALFRAFEQGEISDLHQALAALSIYKGRFFTPNEYLGYDERYSSFVTVRITPDQPPEKASTISQTRELP